MTTDEIKRMQRVVGAEDDGIWGSKSKAACKNYLRQLMPVPHPWPREGSAAFRTFYGPHGVKDGYTPPLVRVKMPFMLYYESKARQTISVHERVADSILRVMQTIALVYDTPGSRKVAGISIYDGCYNPRPIRGTKNSWSTHAWAISLDFDYQRNGNNDRWPQDSHMPIEVMEIFAREGWLPGGAFWGRDGGHMQATL